jgi:hypothetical protein
MTNKAKYSIGSSDKRALSAIEGLGEQDKAAIGRLWGACGTAEDLVLAASLYDELGEHANAEELMKLLTIEDAVLLELNRSDKPSEIGLHMVAHSAHGDGEFEIWTGNAGRFRRVVSLDCVAEYRWEIIADADESLTIEQQKALRKFWWHMFVRIGRDANIQYYCGAFTKSLRLCVEAFVALHPERAREDVERELLASNVAVDSDVLRLRRRVEELERGGDA